MLRLLKHQVTDNAENRSYLTADCIAIELFILKRACRVVTPVLVQVILLKLPCCWGSGGKRVFGTEGASERRHIMPFCLAESDGQVFSRSTAVDFVSQACLCCGC